MWFGSVYGGVYIPLSLYCISMKRVETDVKPQQYITRMECCVQDDVQVSDAEKIRKELYLWGVYVARKPSGGGTENDCGYNYF